MAIISFSRIAGIKVLEPTVCIQRVFGDMDGHHTTRVGEGHRPRPDDRSEPWMGEGGSAPAVADKLVLNRWTAATLCSRRSPEHRTKDVSVSRGARPLKPRIPRGRSNTSRLVVRELAGQWNGRGNACAIFENLFSRKPEEDGERHLASVSLHNQLGTSASSAAEPFGHLLGTYRCTRASGNMPSSHGKVLPMSGREPKLLDVSAGRSRL